jgi:DNA-binding transcriptional regulator YiaG
MTNNKQQTAVEWQHLELVRINFEYATNKITPREFQEQTKYILEQAKEMEKEQIRKAFRKGMVSNKTFDDYYNETYGGNNG